MSELLTTVDRIDAYEEGVRMGWQLALAWAGIEDETR